MAGEKAKDLRQMGAEELAGKVTAWEQELFQARCENALGQSNNPVKVRELRRNVARAKTLINEAKRNVSK